MSAPDPIPTQSAPEGTAPSFSKPNGPLSWLSPTLLLLLVLAAWANSLSSPLVFDDIDSIANNPTLHSLKASLTEAPPPNAGVHGRPLSNLSYALNYAIGGTDVRSFHFGNLLLHAASACLLFSVLRRTLRLPSLAGNPLAEKAELFAFCAAALWAAHPLQTQTVTYLSQRTEALMGFFYLLTFFGFLKGMETQTKRWKCATVVFCALGMASKETMVTAPFMLLLFDRIFIADSWSSLVRTRAKWHLGLLATLLLLALLLAGKKYTNHLVGYGLGVTPFDYALTETRAVLIYLARAWWPHPLVFDYGLEIIRAPKEVLMHILLLSGILGATIITLFLKPKLGYALFWFFALLAPTSSVVPIVGQPIAESRVYLSLAGMVVLVTLLLHRIVGKHYWVPASALILAAGIGTHMRNRVYASELTLWADTAAKAPNNPRAFDHLGSQLMKLGRMDEAEVVYKKAVTLKPGIAESFHNLGVIHIRHGRSKEAIDCFAEAVRLDPASGESLHNLGKALAENGRVDEGLTFLSKAAAARPNDPVILLDLAATLTFATRTTEAAAVYRKLIEIDPKQAGARVGLGAILAHQGAPEEAMKEYRTALELAPDHAIALFRVAELLAGQGKNEEALPIVEKALRADAGLSDAYNVRGVILARLGRMKEAVDAVREAVRQQPGNAAYTRNLEILERILQSQTGK